MSVTVGILTWPSTELRVEFFRRTIESLRRGLVGDYKMVCSSEADSSEELISEIIDICDKNDIELNWRFGRPNQGNNLNYLLSCCRSDYILLVDDDCILIKPLDISDAIRAISSEPLITGIFFPCTGYNRSADFVTAGRFYGGRSYPTWHVMSMMNRYIAYSSGFLIRRNFVNIVGKYIENQYHGRAEEEMNERLKKMGAVVVFPNATYFDHIAEIRANGSAC